MESILSRIEFSHYITFMDYPLGHGHIQYILIWNTTIVNLIEFILSLIEFIMGLVAIILGIIEFIVEFVIGSN